MWCAPLGPSGRRSKANSVLVEALEPSLLRVSRAPEEQLTLLHSTRDILRQPMTSKWNVWIALFVLTSLNFINYVDRSILFAVQELVKVEFALSDKEIGF